MNHVARFFIENSKFTWMLTVLTFVYGIMGVSTLNSESFPSVDIGSVIVTTRYEGATAEDIETKITKPIEEEIQKVSGLKKVRSISQAGVSTIITEADIDKYPTQKVIADLQRAVDRASGLPPDLKSKPIFTEIKSDEFPIIDVAVIGSSQDRLRDRVADLLSEELKDNKKISNVKLTGFRERRFNIYLNRESLVREHVSISEVQAALQFRNVAIPAGELKDASTQKLIRIEGKATSSEELEQLVVRSNFSGQKILLRDLGRIEDGSEDAVTLASIDGRPASFLTISKKGGADLLQLSKEIQKTIDRFSQKYNGKLEFQIFNNEGIRVQNRLDVLISNGWQGMLLVLFFLLLFLPGKVGFMTALSLPLALFATFGYMKSSGFSLNTITIIALVIAIGMLVDNAVVISENFARLRQSGEDTVDALVKTINDLWAPITATALTTIASFLPMLVTTGIMGQFIKGIPIVVSIALVLSLVESFFLLPIRLKAIGTGIGQATAETQSNPGFFDRTVKPRFESLVTWMVDHKLKAVGLLTGLMFATILMLAFVNKVNLFPADQTEIYVGRLTLPKGSRLEQTQSKLDEAARRVSELLKERLVAVALTAGDSRFDLADPKAEVGSNVGLIRIFVDRVAQDTLTTKSVLDRLRTIQVTGVESLAFEAKVNGPPVGDPVSVTVRSGSMEQLSEVAEILRQKLAETKGIFDAKIDDVFGDDEVAIEVDYVKAARLGLSLFEIGNTVRTAVAGLKTGDLNLDNREVDYYLRFEETDRQTIRQLQQVQVSDQRGNLIPLSSFAVLSERKGQPQIKRYDFKRSKTVTANLDDSVITSPRANALIRETFESVARQYPEVSIEFGGEAEKTNESVGSLFRALILSLMGIFALLVLLFKSFTMPFIILTTIPLGLVGVAISFFVHQKALSFMAIIGIIGLGGIIVNSGIILIATINQFRTESEASLREILIQSAVMRLKPVLVSSLTTFSGLIPTAYGIGGVDYFIIPMAMALAWGLASGTVLTLLWVPPAYALVDDLTRWFQVRVKGFKQ